MSGEARAARGWTAGTRGEAAGQRRGALVSGIVLGAMALGIYLVVILKFVTR